AGRRRNHRGIQAGGAGPLHPRRPLAVAARARPGRLSHGRRAGERGGVLELRGPGRHAWALAQRGNRCAPRTRALAASAPRGPRALAASASRVRGGAVVSSALKRFLETAAIWSIAATNAASLAFEGLLKPLTFRTYCSEAARISSSVTGGSKLNRILILRHTGACPHTAIAA